MKRFITRAPVTLCAIVAVGAVAAMAPASSFAASAMANLETAKKTGVSQPLVGASPAQQAAAANQTCGGPGWFQSYANGLYVSAELGEPQGGTRWGMLRARASSVGEWEKFQVCETSGIYSIYADSNKRWVSTELAAPGGEYGMLRARALSIGAWEKYHFLGCCNDLIFDSEANGYWVEANVGYTGGNYGMVRAGKSTFQLNGWDEFKEG